MTPVGLPARGTDVGVDPVRHACVLLLGAMLLTGASGCRSTQLANDQDHIRTAVMDLHTNQIVDNLIRYRRGLPILQLDYIHMTGTVTDTANGTLGGSQTLGWNRSLAAPVTALSLARNFSNVFNWNVGGTKVNQLTITAEPVTTSPSVYEAYDAFMKDPAHLMETAEPPPPCAALVIRAFAPCGGTSCTHRTHHPEIYYWVPVAFKDAFLQLALHTVAVRTPLPTASSGAFETTVRSHRPEDVKPRGANGRIYSIRVTVDKPVPNDAGYMVVTLKDGRRYSGPNQLRLLFNNDLDPGTPVKELTLTFDREQLNLKDDHEVKKFMSALNGQPVSIRLNNYLPEDVTKKDTGEDQRHQQELIRLQQQVPLPLR